MTDPSPAIKRVAVVTGASRGIGRAIALRLADPTRSNRHVVLVSRTEGPLNDVKATIESNGGAASVVTVDVGDSKALQAAIDAIAEKHGRLDILVNNAGITKDGLALRMSDEDWDLVLDTNLKSAFVATRAAARHMMRGKFGRIVNIASTSGVVGNAGQANYAAAKAGMIGLSKTIAKELGGKGITCNAVAPGFITTDMTVNLPQQIKDDLQKFIAVRRLGTPEDIAAAVEYVTSDDAGFLSGQCIVVDGGMTMA
ncbi:3-oxoacyl-[acyl-carrier protein] reductase [Phycisphaerales bacterium]|nr:3-oxoacyl-[acyl-carrier protein] reductase [Phycisphaerales bacterium]